MSTEQPDVTGAPIPARGRILIQLVELQERILTTGVHLSNKDEHSTIRTGLVRAVGRDCDILLTITDNVNSPDSNDYRTCRRLEPNDVVVFNKISGVDVSRVVGARPGDVLVLHDSEVLLVLPHK